MLSSLQAMGRCRDDLTAITKYVMWNLNERGGGALSRALPDHTDLVSVYQVALETNSEEETNAKDKNKKDRRSKNDSNDNAKGTTGQLTEAGSMGKLVDRRGVDRDYHNLLQLMEEAMSSRTSNNNRTNMVVGGLVQHIVSGWTLQFCQSVTTKFNCYFMLPFVDDFHRFARQELQKTYDGETDSLAEVFDMTAAREALQKHRDHLIKECLENKKLQSKFQSCAEMMAKGGGVSKVER
jgi:hypothetical protein